jgi:GT2 family glycosyltransferase
VNTPQNLAPEKKPSETKKTPTILKNIQQQPVTLSSKDGSRKIIVKIDTVDIDENTIRITGWSTGIRLPFCLATANEAIHCSTDTVTRPEVEDLFENNKTIDVHGYQITAKLDPSHVSTQLFLTFGFESQVYLYPLEFKLEDSKSYDLKNMKLSTSLNSKCHIDFCGAIPGKIGVMGGWCIAKPGVIVWLVDSQGNRKDITTCLRFHRDDIEKAFKEEYSTKTVFSGFVTNWVFPQAHGDSIALVEEHDGAFKVVALSTWTTISDDPVSYAKFCFQVPTPAQDFNYRLESWEGQAINSLIEEKNIAANAMETDPKIWDFGSLNTTEIEYSIVIPLYGRWDFVEHQLLEFSKDPVFQKKAEIIYVIDDPLLITPFVNEAEALYNLYQVPFKIIWGHRNRGFSGANNLGVRHSQGNYLILLNSDVFPTHAGWIQSLCHALINNKEYGIIGAKLLFPDDSLQHGGMTFLFSESWSVWLNKHPLAGLDPLIDSSLELMEKPAVTGACMAMSRANYVKLGGFDEGYLIGDFEDSDLCMKVRADGLKIGYLPSVVLTHLERQSFALLGDNSFRTLVVRYNAWRHSTRWAKEISALMKAFEIK